MRKILTKQMCRLDEDGWGLGGKRAASESRSVAVEREREAALV